MCVCERVEKSDLLVNRTSDEKRAGACARACAYGRDKTSIHTDAYIDGIVGKNDDRSNSIMLIFTGTEAHNDHTTCVSDACVLGGYAPVSFSF